MLTVVVAEGVAIALLAVLVLGLLRSHALILKALHELGAGLELERQAGTGVTTATTGGGPGSVPVELERGVVPATRTASHRAADVVGTTLDGADATVTVTAPGSRTLLAFLTSGCSVCQTFWEEFRSGAVDVPGNGTLRVVAKGPAEESPSTLRSLASAGAGTGDGDGGGGGEVEVVQSSAAWTDYDIPGSPYFVYVEAGVVTGEGSATTWPQVRDLMAQAVADGEEARRAAGRPGPGTLPGDRDSIPHIDHELLGAGIHPGHPSLYQSPDGAPAERGAERGAARGTEPGAAPHGARHHEH